MDRGDIRGSMPPEMVVSQEIRGPFLRTDRESKNARLVFQLKRLGASDIALMRKLNAMFGRAFEEEARYAEAPPSDDDLKARLTRPHVIVLAAMEGERPVGGLIAYELPKFEQAKSEVYLYDLAVDAPFRRRGVAAALIEALKPIAQACGADVIFVQADRDDASAIALYRKLAAREAEEPFHFDIACAAGAE